MLIKQAFPASLIDSFMHHNYHKKMGRNEEETQENRGRLLHPLPARFI